MVLESTMICVDNSDFMRNGDFVPTRLQAQQDAVYLVCRSKSRAHPQNDVGLITLSKVQVLVTLTTDIGKIFVTLNRLSPDGNVDFSKALRVAQLALKHRQEKNHKMRIIAFVGSPISLSDQELVALAKKLKKEKVNVDVVSFGHEAETCNAELLAAFIDTLNGKEGGSSHLLIVPSGPFLTGALVSSPIVLGEDGSGAVPEDYDLVVDADEDPELALALKMSLAEHRRKEEAQTSGAKQGESLSDVRTTEKPENLESAPDALNPKFMTEEELIAYAIQLSMKDQSSETNQQTPLFDLDDFLADTDWLKRIFEELENMDDESGELEGEEETEDENEKQNKKNGK